MTHEEIKKLLSEREELQHEILSAVLRNDVMGVLNSISESAPRILTIDHLFMEEGVDVDSILASFETKVEVEVESEGQPGEVELQEFLDKLGTALQRDGHTCLSPTPKDRDRISSLLAKPHRKGAALSMVKLTSALDKLFRRGVELNRRGYAELAADFFVKIAAKYDIEPPRIWVSLPERNDRAPKETEEVDLKIISYTPDQYSDEMKVRAFDAIMRFTTRIVRGIIEEERDPSEYGITAVRYLVAMLGPAALRSTKLEGRRTLIPDNVEGILEGENDDN